MATTTTTKKPRTLGPGVLKSTDTSLARDFSADVTKVLLNPSNSTDDPVNFLDGSQELNTTTSWTLEATVMDDYTAGGINNWCLEHGGQTIPMRFVPSSDGEVAYQFDATVTPIGIGGDVKAKNTQDISWPITNLQSRPAQEVPVQSVTISGNGVNAGKLTIRVDQSVQLTANVSPANATDSAVTWTTSDSSVVRCDNEWIRGMKTGTATVTATAGGRSAQLAVTVTAAASSSLSSTTGQPSAE